MKNINLKTLGNLLKLKLITKLTPPQNEHFVINHLMGIPPCLSKPVKALFIFGTQFKIF